MNDLVEFLIARITEDEARAARLWDAMQSDEFTAPASLINLGALVDPRRVLAECEAKRRIIEELGPPHFLTGGSSARLPHGASVAGASLCGSP